jgi:hypothetical protein
MSRRSALSAVFPERLAGAHAAHRLMQSDGLVERPAWGYVARLVQALDAIDGRWGKHSDAFVVVRYLDCLSCSHAPDGCGEMIAQLADPDLLHCDRMLPLTTGPQSPSDRRRAAQAGPSPCSTAGRASRSSGTPQCQQ